MHRPRHIFQNHHVASLVWAIGSSPLMQGRDLQVHTAMLTEEWYSHQLELHWDFFLELDAGPQPLLDCIEQESPKLLGKYFETLIGFWLHTSPHFSLISRNIQLMDGKSTLGEADILARDLASGELWQIELACKYYLGHQNMAAQANWIGPNGSDSLALKMEKFKKQTSLFEHPRGKEFLSEHDLEFPSVKILMKGFFFHHYKLLSSHKSPKNAGLHYNSGWYIRLNEINDLAGSMQQWVVLPKFLWPCLYNFAIGLHPVLDGNEMIRRIREQIDDGKRSILLAQVEVRDGWAREISRGFVVPDTWPNVRSVG